MPHQVDLTVMARIKPGSTDSLLDCLGVIREDPDHNNIFRFSSFDNVHFGRLLVIPESRDLRGNVVPPALILSTNVDDPLDDHLAKLVDVAGPGLDKIFTHCEGYPADGARTGDSRLTFLKSGMIGSNAFYVNYVGRTLNQARQEAQLREALEGFLDDESQNRDWASMSPLDIHAAIQDFAGSEPSLSWAMHPAERPGLGWRIKQTIKKIGIPLALALLSPAILIGLPLYAVILRIKEKTDVPDRIKPTIEHVSQISAGEDFFAHNPFSGVGYLKLGIFRLLTVKTVLWLVNYGANHHYNKGRLSGVGTIHFARWIIIDQNRRALFMSNYDGSQESYMSDFIDKVAWGLNAVFSNGAGWPKTRWLLKGGAENELEFKNFMRIHQLPTQVWYTAHGDLTANNIANNAAIRSGLYQRMNRRKTEEWLRRF